MTFRPFQSQPRQFQPRRIPLSMLKRALKAGGMIDASSLVLKFPNADIITSNARTGVHQPPFLVSAWDLEAFDEKPEKGRASIRDFERLSLAARIALTVGPDTTAHAFKDQTETAGLDISAFPEVDPRDILTALAWVADELGPDQGRMGLAATAEQLAMRGGLQLIGCRIAAPAGEAEDGLRLVNARQPISLRLIGCVIECPVLLAHCELVSLDLSGSAMRSLDATGLRAKGSVHLRRTLVQTPVSFAGARVAGSFNGSDMVLAPFSSVVPQIPIEADHGMLNLSRATIENEVRLDGARIWGGLSLRGATVGRSLFMNRATLTSPLGLLEKCAYDHYGDLIPDHDVARDIALSDEALALRMHDPDRPREPKAFTPPPGVKATDWVDLSTALQTMEVLQHETERWRSLINKTLIRLRTRALTSAVRADGLKVKGSFFARAITSNGKFRMKYAEIEGGLRFEGSLFRCAGDITVNLERQMAAWREMPSQHGSPEDMKDFWDGMARLLGSPRFQKDLSSEKPDVALDLRDSQLKGDLSFGSTETLKVSERPEGSSERDMAKELRSRLDPLELIGAMTLKGMQTSGSIILCGLRARRPRVVTEAYDAWIEQRDLAREGTLPPVDPHAPKTPEQETYGALFERTGETSQALPQRLFRRVVTFLLKGAFQQHSRRSNVWRTARRTLLDLSRNPDQQMLSLSQIKVGRDVDLRGVKDVHGVDLENAIIGGDLHFSEKSSGRARDDDDGAGFIDCARRAVGLRGTVNLRAADIAGDAFLIFDAREGPNLIASMAQIGGRLDIYPAIYASDGGRNYQFLRNSTPQQQEQKAKGFWLDSCIHETPLRRNNILQSEVFCERCRLMIDKVDDHMSWFIDLRQARAAVFGHPPAAWPDPGALSLDGFVYEQSSDLGPLAPKPMLVGDMKQLYEARRLRFVLRQKPLLRRALGGVALLGFGVLIAAWTTLLWTLSSWPWLFFPALLVTGVGVSGGVNFAPRRNEWGGAVFGWILLALVAISAGAWLGGQGRLAPTLVFASSLTAAIWLIARLTLLAHPAKTTRRLRQPRGHDPNMPRAIEYLARQRISESRFKGRPSGYHVLDSYARAAKALREAGRYISANLVEEERLRRRTEMMSWRHHGPAKLVLRLVDLFAGYGFQLSRAIAIVCVLILAIASLSHYAAATGYLVHVEPPSAAEAKPRTTIFVTADPRSGEASQMVDRRESFSAHSPFPATQPGGCGSSATAASLEQDCPDLIYAADLLLPFIDLGEEKRWKAQIPERAADGIRWWIEPFESVWVSVLRSWPALINMLGLLLSAIMATAVAARVESAFARVEE